MRISPLKFLLRLCAISLACVLLAGHLQAQAASTDLNSASEKDLESLPGVGAATAKKIIAGRPYSSVGDLSKAGISASTITKITPLVRVGGSAPAAAPSKQATRANAAASHASSGTMDLNSASEKDLESLPGVGAATAKKIIAGRPYSSVSDLSKAGVSASTIDKITPLVAVSGAAPIPVARASTSSAPASTPAASMPSGGKIDLNSASEKDLDALPGVGPATAKKIIEGRPYSSAGDLSKAGVSASTITKITPLVTVGGAPASSSYAAPPSKPGAPPAPAPAPAASRPPPVAATQQAAPPPTRPAQAAVSQGTPGPGTVWVNVDTGVYHYPNSRYYGKTEKGKYMTEAEALSAGYHAAKNEKKPQ